MCPGRRTALNLDLPGALDAQQRPVHTLHPDRVSGFLEFETNCLELNTSHQRFLLSLRYAGGRGFL
jgi:hypothetical protein